MPGAWLACPQYAEWTAEFVSEAQTLLVLHNDGNGIVAALPIELVQAILALLARWRWSDVEMCDTRCTMCDSRLFPCSIEPSVFIGGRGYTRLHHFVCRSCAAVLCSNCLPGVMRLTAAASQQVHDRADHAEDEEDEDDHEEEKLSVSAVLGAGASSRLLEVAARDEDDERACVMDGECRACGRSEAMYEIGRSCRMCGRCGSAFDVSDHSGCVAHPGSHEMPLDAHGQPTFGLRLLDIGGNLMIHSVVARALPGRWTCCGRTCYHDIYACPVAFVDHEAPTTADWHRVEALAALGCVEAQHDEAFVHRDKRRDAVPEQQGANYTGEWRGVGRGTAELNWRAKVSFNTAPPVRYPSGAPYIAQPGDSRYELIQYS